MAKFNFKRKALFGFSRIKSLKISAFYSFSLAIILFLACNRTEDGQQRVILQLNWLHDPTFVGHYYLAYKKSGIDIKIKEGGANISPLTEVLAGRADIAIVGANIFLKYLESQEEKNKDLVYFFVEFQRNPVGWVLNPSILNRYNLNLSSFTDGAAINTWVSERIKEGVVVIGDKRGTETTAVLSRWLKKRGLQNVQIRPVGFDPSVVLTSENLLFPVYLNEEPFKLGEKLGQDVLIVDPSFDGVKLYGNILVAKRSLIEQKKDLISNYISQLRAAYKHLYTSEEALKEALNETKKFYKGVSDKTLVKQIRATLNFVFVNSEVAGRMSKEGWEETIEALKEAEILKILNFDGLVKYLHFE
jgi:ABC-type nitrate/sulfonate/bicarbonate transport system substrate-binding protein